MTRGGLDPGSCAQAQERIEGRGPTQCRVWSEWPEAEGEDGANGRRLERVRRVHARLRHQDPAH